MLLVSLLIFSRYAWLVITGLNLDSYIGWNPYFSIYFKCAFLMLYIVLSIFVCEKMQMLLLILFYFKCFGIKRNDINMIYAVIYHNLFTTCMILF